MTDTEREREKLPLLEDGPHSGDAMFAFAIKDATERANALAARGDLKPSDKREVMELLDALARIKARNKVGQRDA